ncbi:unnamed protein product [Sphagnum jensenii]|jgi:hypothetical protein|uniref:Uncharacterized protein n=1 Tax=Sphagnum jensenii TaxID=128206 RepID=A0ABP1BUS0_9BRYO
MSSARKEGRSSLEGSLGPFSCVNCAKVLNNDHRCTVLFCSQQCKMEAVERHPSMTQLSNPRIFSSEEYRNLLRAAILNAVALTTGKEEYDIISN